MAAYREDIKAAAALGATPSFAELDLKMIAEKFLFTESIYVERGLRVAVENFKVRMDKKREMNEPVLGIMEQMTLFQNIESLYDFHKKLYQTLKLLRYEGIELFLRDLGNVMLEVIPFFRLYAQYVNKYDAQIVDSYKQTQPAMFGRFLQLEEQCCGTDLKKLLSFPVYRLPQYMAYLDQMARRTEPGTVARQELMQAINNIKQVCDEITQKRKSEKLRKMVVTISKEVFNDEVNIMAAHRLFVRSGTCQYIKDPKTVGIFQSHIKDYDMWLFNDMLCLGHVNGGLLRSSGVIRMVMRIEGMTVQDANDGADYKDAFIVSNNLEPNNVETWVLATPDKTKWMQILNKIVNRGNEDKDNIRRGEWIPTTETFFNNVIGKETRDTRQIRRPNYAAAKHRMSLVIAKGGDNNLPARRKRAITTMHGGPPPPGQAPELPPRSKEGSTGRRSSLPSAGRNPPPPIPNQAPVVAQASAKRQSSSDHRLLVNTIQNCKSLQRLNAIVDKLVNKKEDLKQQLADGNCANVEAKTSQLWEVRDLLNRAAERICQIREAEETKEEFPRPVPSPPIAAPTGPPLPIQGAPPAPEPEGVPGALHVPKTEPPAFASKTIGAWSRYMYYENTTTGDITWNPPQDVVFDAAAAPTPPAFGASQPLMAPAAPIAQAPTPPPLAPGPPSAPPMAPGPPRAPRASVPAAGGLMDQIQAGKALKKASAAPASKRGSVSGQPSLLEQIQKGRQLKKTEDVVWDEPVEQATGMQAALQKSMAQYRKFVAVEDDNDDDSDDDFWD